MTATEKVGESGHVYTGDIIADVAYAMRGYAEIEKIRGHRVIMQQNNYIMSNVRSCKPVR